jgi:hypothetical protein
LSPHDTRLFPNHLISKQSESAKAKFKTKYVTSGLVVSIALPASADTRASFADLLIFGDKINDPGNRKKSTNGTE